MEKIRLIGMDLDNTILDYSSGEPRIGEEFMEWFNAFVAAGGHAGVVTGRYYHEIPLTFTGLGFDWCAPFPDFTVYRESFITFADDGRHRFLDEHNKRASVQISENLLPLGNYVQRFYELLTARGLTIVRWNLYGDFALEYALADVDQAQAAANILSEELARDGLGHIYQTHRNATLASAYWQGAGKGNTLVAVGKHFGLKPQQMLAIGDSLNDLTMVDGSLGIRGACVGNADLDLRRAVQAGGGIVGESNAWKSILGIVKQLHKLGYIDL